MPEESFPQELLLVSEQDCQDPRKICESLICSKERKDEDGVWVIKCWSDKGSERTKSKDWERQDAHSSARRWFKGNRNALASFCYFAFYSFIFHLRPCVFSCKSAIPLEHNFPDIRSTGFHFRFLFCASYASASSSICLSSPEHMRWKKERRWK